MKSSLHKKFFFVLIFLLFTIVFLNRGFAQDGDAGLLEAANQTEESSQQINVCDTAALSYHTLVNIPGLGEESVDKDGNTVYSVTICPDSLAKYLKSIFNYIIGIALALTVIMVIYGGVIYATTDAAGKKNEGKKIIQDAFYGLALVLSSWLILYTINPDLIKFNLGVDNIEYGELSKGGVAEKIELPSGGGGSPSAFSSGTSRGKSINITLTNGQQVTINGCDESQMVDYTFAGKAIKIHPSMISSLRRIEAGWKASGNRYNIRTVGGYRCTTIKDPRTGRDTGVPSAHGYGIVLDINAAQNRHGATLVTDMPPSFRQLFINEGWGWGGNWRSSKDAMHFSKYRGEGGNQRE